MITSTRTRLLRHTIKTNTCWLWRGSKNNKGYGIISRGSLVDGRALVHRMSWELFRGPIPLGMCVLHRCDTPLCLRPSHLMMGTQKDNLNDMRLKGRWHIRRPARGENHHLAKLTASQVRLIRSRSSLGPSQLARRFHVTASNISQVLLGRTWKHV